MIYKVLFFIIKILVFVLTTCFLYKLLRGTVKAIIVIISNSLIVDLLIIVGGVSLVLVLALFLGISIQGLSLIFLYLNVISSILFICLGGFMVIIKYSKNIIGQDMQLAVTNIVQTSVGCLIFAKMKGENYE